MSQQFNPIELLKSATAALSEVPDEFGAEHANVLKLEMASRAIHEMMDYDDRSFEDAAVNLTHSPDPSFYHIGNCAACLSGVRQFLVIYPTKDEIGGASSVE